MWCTGSGSRVFRWFTFSSDQTANPPETLTNQTTRQTSAYMEIVLKKLIYHSKVIHLQIYWFFFFFYSKPVCVFVRIKKSLFGFLRTKTLRERRQLHSFAQNLPDFHWLNTHTHTHTHDYSSRSGHKCSLHSHRLEVHTRNDLGCVQNNIPAYYTQK